MNILFVHSRDVEINDSGGARTLILLMNHLSNKSDVKCYAMFDVCGINIPNLTIIQRKGTFEEQLKNCVKNYSIDIVMVPEAVLLGKRVSKALSGTNCHIVSALHNKPGYEKQNLHILLMESLFLNENWLKRIRALICLCLFPLFYWTYVNKQKKNFIEAYNNTDYLVLLSSSFFKDFVKEYSVTDGGKKLRAVGNGLSFKEFATEETLRKKKKQILVVSRFEERQKRLSRVFKIWKSIQSKLNDWNLVIVGFGRSEPYYNHLVKKYHLYNIELVGKQSPQQYYLDSAIFLMTSDYEGWGMTITEAQQCGCIPIALNTYSSLSDLINDGENGFVVENEEQMKNRILEMANGDVDIKRMAVNAIESSKRFLPEKIYDGYYSIFKEIVEGK